MDPLWRGARAQEIPPAREGCEGWARVVSGASGGAPADYESGVGHAGTLPPPPIRVKHRSRVSPPETAKSPVEPHRSVVEPVETVAGRACRDPRPGVSSDLDKLDHRWVVLDQFADCAVPGRTHQPCILRQHTPRVLGLGRDPAGAAGPAPAGGTRGGPRPGALVRGALRAGLPGEGDSTASARAFFSFGFRAGCVRFFPRRRRDHPGRVGGAAGCHSRGLRPQCPGLWQQLGELGGESGVVQDGLAGVRAGGFSGADAGGNGRRHRAEVGDHWRGAGPRLEAPFAARR